MTSRYTTSSLEHLPKMTPEKFPEKSLNRLLGDLSVVMALSDPSDRHVSARSQVCPVRSK